MAKRRHRGTIEPRGPGCWLVRVTLGEDGTGKRDRVSRTVRGTKTDAQRVLTDLLDKRDHGTPLPRTRMTFGDWLDAFDTTWSGGLGPQTRENTQQSIRNHVTPALRGVRLLALKPEHFQTLYNDMEARGLAPATISFLHRALRSRLTKALELGHLAYNPLTAASPPAETRREYRVLSATEAKVFLEEIDGDDYAALWILLLLTGLRPAEALGLKWEDLDGERLTVRRNLVRLAKGKWVLADTKTKRGRTITLPATVARALTRHKARQATIRLKLGAEYAAHGLMFASTFGEPLWWANLVDRHFQPALTRTALRLAGLTVPPAPATRAERRQWAGQAAKVEAAALEATGLAKMRPYDLRHSAATLLLAAGEHPKIVAELLGHSKVTLTLDTYSHVSPAMLDQAAKRMEDIVGGPLVAQANG